MSTTRRYHTVTLLLGVQTLVMSNAIEDADDHGRRVLVGKITGGNHHEAAVGSNAQVSIGSLPIRRIADGIYTVIDIYPL